MTETKRVSLVFFMECDENSANQFADAVQLFVKKNFGLKDKEMEKHMRTVYKNNNEINERNKSIKR